MGVRKVTSTEGGKTRIGLEAARLEQQSLADGLPPDASRRAPARAAHTTSRARPVPRPGARL